MVGESQANFSVKDFHVCDDSSFGEYVKLTISHSAKNDQGSLTNASVESDQWHNGKPMGKNMLQA